jgi:hypothetical protein
VVEVAEEEAVEEAVAEEDKYDWRKTSPPLRVFRDES